MVEDYSQSTMKVSGIKPPKYTWKCKLTNNTYWMVEEGKEPNWFHRKMQELCFGIKWEKNDTV
jgi:hypothetical protein